jgi:transposase-like protein
MKAKYTQAFKQQAVQKALNRADGVSLRSITDQLGVGYSTIEKWIRLSRAQKLEISDLHTDEWGTPMSTERKPQEWNLEQRMEMIFILQSCVSAPTKRKMSLLVFLVCNSPQSRSWTKLGTISSYLR